MENQPVQTTPRQPIPAPVSFQRPSVKQDKSRRSHKILYSFLALVIIVLAIGGMYFWQHTKVNNDNTEISKLKSQVTSLKGQVSTITKAEKSSEAALSQLSDPTANWASFTSEDSKFSLKYPSAWVLENYTGCSSTAANQFGIGPNTSSAGNCKSNVNPEIRVIDTAHTCLPLSSSNYTTLEVTVAGASGKEYTGTSDGSTTEKSAIGPSGTKYTEYCIPSPTDSNLVYEATYIQEPTYPDASSDFNLMVTKSLEIN